MKVLRSISFFALLCILSSYSILHLYQLHSDNREKRINDFILLPETIAQAISLEYRGVISDYLMLKTLTYTGNKIIHKESLSPNEWQMIYHALVQITNLDPRFLDPYLIAAMSLPQEADMVTESNILLEKAGKVLTNDYRPYFFLWYNYYYFLDDPATAGSYLEKSALVPGAPPYFATLAARTSLSSGKTDASIIFLQEVIKETSDPFQLKLLKLRLEVIRKIGFLELKIQAYKKQFHTAPQNLQQLIEKNIITAIPADPYGGEFYITETGSVYTTSKLVFFDNKKPETP